MVLKNGGRREETSSLSLDVFRDENVHFINILRHGAEKCCKNINMELFRMYTPYERYSKLSHPCMEVVEEELITEEVHELLVEVLYIIIILLLLLHTSRINKINGFGNVIRKNKVLRYLHIKNFLKKKTFHTRFLS